MIKLDDGNMEKTGSQAGFTLIELMLTLLISMVIMAGLLMTFLKQNEVYKYQNTRVDTVQDVEFVVNYLADELRLALVSPAGSTAANATRPVENANFAGTGNTTSLEFEVWVDPLAADFNTLYNGVVDPLVLRAKKKYELVVSNGTNCFATNPLYTGKDYCLRYDREASSGAALTASDEMIRGVTMFKVFRDDSANPNASRASFPNIPAELPLLKAGGFGVERGILAEFAAGTGTVQVQDSDGLGDTVPGYTILLEVAVDSAYKHGSFIDAMGRDVRTLETPPRKRVIRYVQVYPMTAVP